jgi:hypothetical protein
MCTWRRRLSQMESSSRRLAVPFCQVILLHGYSRNNWKGEVFPPLPVSCVSSGGLSARWSPQGTPCVSGNSRTIHGQRVVYSWPRHDRTSGRCSIALILPEFCKRRPWWWSGRCWSVWIFHLFPQYEWRSQEIEGCSKFEGPPWEWGRVAVIVRRWWHCSPEVSPGSWRITAFTGFGDFGWKVQYAMLRVSRWRIGNE